MCSFILTTKEIKNSKKVNLYSKRRGPDHTEIVSFDKYYIIHNLLSITGVFTKQPFIDDGIAAFYNGEIYNYQEFGNFSSDGECLIKLYKKYGEGFLRKLDGEFAICIVDLNKEHIVFSTDTFKTKPLWFSVDDLDIGVSSYRSDLEHLGHVNITKAKPNTIYIYSMTTMKLREETLYDFDLKQYKDSFDDWISAFQSAIKKRTANINEKIFIGLSSGYDSGAIFCELLKKKVDFAAYSIIGEEKEEILLKRHKMHNNTAILDNSKANFNTILRHIIRNCEKYSHQYYDMLQDESSWGLGLLCMQAINDGRKIFLSGSGADEIISDYGFGGTKFNNNSEFGGLFPDDLSKIFPWMNFYYGSQECYLAREEYVCGSYGLEARYPFLDRNLVQEFIWLKPYLKNKNYKAPIKEYFDRVDFPYVEEKIGFFFLKHDFDVNSLDALNLNTK